MIINKITVTIHEKRAHPHAMGHKDCEVAYEAELFQGDNEPFAVSELRQRANAHVQAELDAWIASIEEQRRLDMLRVDLIEKLRSVRHAHSLVSLEESRSDTITTIKMLPKGERAEAYRHLAANVGVAMKNISKPKDDAPDAESEIPF